MSQPHFDQDPARTGGIDPESPQPGRFQVRPLGGVPGCIGMILFSILASVILTVLLNLLVR